MVRVIAKRNWKLACSIKLHTMTNCQLCRFISAMEKLAELSSDKEQLEHLVERLQEETDTIGDYVIMYQHQRKQQRIKIQEKEQEVCPVLPYLVAGVLNLNMFHQHFITDEETS